MYGLGGELDSPDATQRGRYLVMEGAARRRRRMRSAHGDGGELGAGYEQHGGGEREGKGDGLQGVTER